MLNNWSYCVIDASRSTDDEFCFVQVCKGESGFSVKHENRIMSDEAPAEIVGVMHPEGEDKADEWAQTNFSRIKELVLYYQVHGSNSTAITYH